MPKKKTVFITVLGCVYQLSQVRNTFSIPTIKTRKNKKKDVSNPLIKTALRLSSVKITLKVVWKRQNARSVMINAPIDIYGETVCAVACVHT